MSYKKGPLLEALERGQPVVLRHLDKADGPSSMLPTIAMFAAGDFDRVDIYDPLGEKLSFDKKNVGGFTLSATATDADTLAPSLRARLGGRLMYEPDDNAGATKGPAHKK
jgi:hypothetical protein